MISRYFFNLLQPDNTDIVAAISSYDDEINNRLRLTSANYN